MKRCLPFTLIGCLLPLSASAEMADWDYSATIYGWVPSLSATVDTSFGQLESKSRGSDALDNLDMAFMSTFEARRDQWGVLFDLVYADLSTSKDTPFGALFSKGDIETKMTALSAYALYRSYDSERLAVDVGLGVRAFSVDLDTRLKPGLLAEQDFSSSKSWAVPLVGARLIAPLNENWFATAYFDYGQTSSDVSTWQGVATVGYRFNEKWAMQFGYRYMDIQQEFADHDTDLELQGPLIGLRVQF